MFIFDDEDHIKTRQDGWHEVNILKRWSEKKEYLNKLQTLRERIHYIYIFLNAEFRIIAESIIQT